MASLQPSIAGHAATRTGRPARSAETFSVSPHPPLRNVGGVLIWFFVGIPAYICGFVLCVVAVMSAPLLPFLGLLLLFPAMIFFGGIVTGAEHLLSVMGLIGH